MNKARQSYKNSLKYQQAQLKEKEQSFEEQELEYEIYVELNN